MFGIGWSQLLMSSWVSHANVSIASRIDIFGVSSDGFAGAFLGRSTSPLFGSADTLEWLKMLDTYKIHSLRFLEYSRFTNILSSCVDKNPYFRPDMRRSCET